MNAGTHDLTVDARAELIARAKNGRASLDPMTNQLVRGAVEVAVYLAYLADLRPFAKWVSTALKHGKSAGAVFAPPSFRREAEHIALPPPENRLKILATRAYEIAMQHGVRSAEFREAAQLFEENWDLVANKLELMPPAPAHREISFFVHGLAHALATFLRDDNIGPSTFALILAAIGTDAPIVRHSTLESPTEAINARAATCQDIWQLESQRARTAATRYITMPEMPGPVLNGGTGRLSGNLFRLSTGETIAARPAGVPLHAKVAIERRGARRWIYARWREDGKPRSVALSPTAHQDALLPPTDSPA